MFVIKAPADSRSSIEVSDPRETGVCLCWACIDLLIDIVDIWDESAIRIPQTVASLLLSTCWWHRTAINICNTISWKCCNASVAIRYVFVVSLSPTMLVII
jgi:hypothetical protein